MRVRVERLRGFEIIHLLSRFDANPAIINSNASLDDGVGGGEMRHRNHEQVLSVSGKKKCSHCDLELGEDCD